MLRLSEVDTLNKGMIHVPGGMEGDNARFRHTTEDGAQLKIYELFMSGTFHLMFSVEHR